MNKMWWGDAGRRGLDRLTWIRAGAALFLIVVLSFGTLPERAQAQTYQFSNVVVEGNQRVDAGTVLSYAQIPRGSATSAAQLNEAFQAIMGSGLFETAELVPQGGTLLIRVVERPTINRIAIEGNRRLDDEDFLPLIQSTPRRVYSATQAEADAAAIVDFLEVQGFFAATVTPRIIRRSENRVDLVFEINEGRTVENQRISFVGNRAFSDRRLRRVLETKQAGLFRAFFRTDTLIEERLEFDETVLRDFYLSRGYIDIQVLDVSAELSRERNATFITFTLQEGQSFEFGDITTVSEVPGVDPAPYQAAARLRSGVVYSPVLLENAITRMENLATRNGLDFVTVEPRVTRDNRNLRLNIEFALVRGERVFVERIDISGNVSTLDRVIRRQFTTVEGDPFNPRAVRSATRRIEALNYFESVDVDTRQGSTSDTVVIDVEVEERPTGSLGIGGSFSSDSGLGLVLTFSETNFLGRGQSLDFELNTTSETGNSQITFTEPALFGRNLAGSISLFAVSTDSNNANFSTENYGISLSLGFPVGEFSRLNLRYRLASSKLRGLDNADTSPILLRETNDAVSSSVGYTYSYDTRFTGNDPNAGIRFAFGQDFAGLGGDVNLVRTFASLTAQRRLRNEDYTVRAIIEGGHLASFGGYSTRVGDRFFIGSSQLRGFDFRGVGPRDLDAVNRDPLGGTNYFTAQFELGFPIGFLEDLGFSGAVFVDFGSVWGLEDVAGAGAPGTLVDDSFRLRSAAGFALVWSSPLGPITFNFTEALEAESYDVTRDFDISLTARF